MDPHQKKRLILNYFGPNKRRKNESQSHTENQSSIATKEKNIFLNALQNQVESLNNTENTESLEEKAACTENNCHFAKLLQENNAAAEILQKKYNGMKAKYVKAMDINLKLQAKMAAFGKSSSGNGDEDRQIDQNELEIQSEFDGDDAITSVQWAELNSVGFMKNYDQTYVRKIIEFLYMDSVEKLKNKSVSGRKNSKNQSTSITPEKKKIIKAMFTKRIEKLCEIDPIEKFNRLDSHYFNQLISNSLQTIKKQQNRLNVPLN